MIYANMLPNYYERLGRLAGKITLAKKTKLATKDYRIIWTEDDIQFSHHGDIEVFAFKPLKVLEQTFRKSGEYTSAEIAELMQGLSRLPRYATKTISKSRSTPRSRK